MSSTQCDEIRILFSLLFQFLAFEISKSASGYKLYTHINNANKGFSWTIKERNTERKEAF